MKGMPTPAPPVAIRLRRRPPVFICKKCMKRVESGSRLKQALKHALRDLTYAKGEKRPRLVATSCFGICPKRAVVVTSGALLHRNDYLLLTDEGAAAGTVATLTDDVAPAG